MMLGMYSIKDSKVSFSGIFHAENDEAALRSFIASVRSSTPNPCNTFPEDKSLYRLGYYDVHSGDVVPDKAFIAKAETYVVEQTAVPLAEGDQNVG